LEEKMLPIMLQLYNLREELAADFAGTLQKIAALGYRSVELAGLYGKSPGEFKAELLKAGLTALSAHVPYRDMRADPEKVMDCYSEIGCKYVVIPYLQEEDRCTSPNYEGVKKEIARLGEIAKNRGLILLYHNHEFEFQQYHGKYALDDLYDSIPADLLQTEIDTCWAAIGGVDPGGYILKYRGRSPVVHLKDFYLPEGLSPENMYELIGQARQADPDAKGGFEFRAIGHGRQDIPSILKAAGEAGASWVVVEQDLPTPGMTALECARDSINYLRGLE
jgi:sugar phosphate isomerase/epimerase